MNNINDSRQKNINDIISIAKLVSLLFCAVIIYSHFFVNNKIAIQMLSRYNLMEMGIFIFTLILIYCVWLIFSSEKIKTKYIKIIQHIENLTFIIFFTSLIILSNNSILQYKFLFLFIIITATLQSGIKYGMSMAVVSSIIILVLDLIYTPKLPINLFLENDLILIGVFILTAWPLGYYVKIENENLKQKNLQLEILSNELKEKDNQRKYIEEMLVRNKSCYNMLIENSRDAILVHRNGNLIFANEGAAKLLGYSDVEDLNGKSIFNFIPKEEMHNIREKLSQLYNNKTTTILFEQKVTQNNGQSIIVENISTCFIYEGKATILTIYRDITSQKKVEMLQNDVEKNIKLLNESRKFNNLITEFFANISHELKTPLNVIFSAVQVLDLYTDFDEEYIKKRSKYLNIMRHNCHRLKRLINNFLDITKVESGFLKPILQNLNIISIVEDITMSVVSYAENKGLSITFDTDVEECHMLFDPDIVERVILNLLSNAIKFTESGGNIYVNITHNKDSVIISVKDTGVGIPDDKLNVIFERFGQVDKTLRRNREGTGIGLSLVKSLVEMHEGKIDVKSKIGEGSEFIIELPIKKSKEPLRDNSVYVTNTETIDMEFSDIYK
ncbi:two-component sensor kinase [Clostridium polyendosporum]|uniref:histidine kinase n=1 Tax=Clostridium polyendosporum TaxID=69208 RepID=A0A919RVU0_9CLOT|nr:PAS domain-containing sensor histidine kinase [Clostridium polyendosporum]GIM27336.1 two-component sensor kinase [Clostridium polyendosporum]